jgi:hypothetical protein
MGRTGWGAIFAFLVVVTASCSSAPNARPSPSRDIPDARPIARAVGEILLSFSAYDYALVGSLNGERIRAVNADRYATIARQQAVLIADTSTKVVAASVDTAGPIRDRLVTLADALGELRKDGLAYADARTPEALVHVIDGVAKGWSLLRTLESLLKDDGTLDKTIARGTGMKVTASPSSGALVTVGPFAGAAEASDRAKQLGVAWSASTESPFVARASFKDRASADAAADALLKQGTIAIVIDQTSYKFARTGVAPDVELWREPERLLDARAGSRRIAMTANASNVAIGSDDGFVAIFTNDGVLRALPRFNAGVNQLVFTDDGRFLFGGGQTLVTWVMPRPTDFVGAPMRLHNAAQSVVFVPKAYAFAASSAGDDGGIIGGRAPDGVPLSDPFPIEVGSSGAILSASDNGELFIASQVGGDVIVRVLNVGRERDTRGIVSVPGALRAFAVDRAGFWAAIVTDVGTFRVAIKSPDPSRTITKVAGPARDIEFAKDGTLYVLEPQRLTAFATDGAAAKWSAQLVDGRSLVIGARPVVLDGTDRLLAFSADGIAEALAPVGQIQDLAASRDGQWIGVIADARRAVLFHLQ